MAEQDSKDVGNRKLMVTRKNFTNHSISSGLIVKEGEQVQLRSAFKPAWHGLTISTESKQWMTTVGASFLLPFTCGMSRETIQEDFLLAERQILLLKSSWPLELNLAVYLQVNRQNLAINRLLLVLQAGRWLFYRAPIFQNKKNS